MVLDYVEIRVNGKIVAVAAVKQGTTSEFIKASEKAAKELALKKEEYDDRIDALYNRVGLLELQIKFDHGEISEEEFLKQREEYEVAKYEKN